MAPQKVVLLACGSFNPPTHMHLRMFEIARDYLNRMGQFCVVGGILSPVHDAYGKKELEASTHRIEMLKLALRSSDWIHLSDWEVNQEGWSKTLQVLQYHQNALNALMISNNRDESIRENGLHLPFCSWISNEMRSQNESITLKLLCGADLLESFARPGLWKESDIETIVGEHGLVVITREGSNPLRFIYESDQLTRCQRNIFIVPEWVTNDVSSTKVRRALKRMESVKYLIDDAVIEYITKHALYGCDKTRFKYDNAVSDYLNIPLNTFLLTPSPSDVNMLSASPSKADDDITLQLQPIGRIDQPDSVVAASQECISPMKEKFKFKSKTEVVQYPGKAVQIHPIVDTPTGKSKKVGFADDPDLSSAKKVLAAMKSAPEVQTVALNKSGKLKKPARLSDPTRSRNAFKRSNSDIPPQRGIDNDVTPVKIEITKEGVKVISDKESIV